MKYVQLTCRILLGIIVLIMLIGIASKQGWGAVVFGVIIGLLVWGAME